MFAWMSDNIADFKVYSHIFSPITATDALRQTMTKHGNGNFFIEEIFRLTPLLTALEHTTTISYRAHHTTQSRIIFCLICNRQYVGLSNNNRARMNRHKSDIRLYAAGKINKMDNKLIYDYLISHYIDYFHVCIVDMIHVGNNTESQLEELLSRKERKWIWELGSDFLLD